MLSVQVSHTALLWPYLTVSIYLAQQPPTHLQRAITRNSLFQLHSSPPVTLCSQIGFIGFVNFHTEETTSQMRGVVFFLFFLVVTVAQHVSFTDANVFKVINCRSGTDSTFKYKTADCSVQPSALGEMSASTTALAFSTHLCDKYIYSVRFYWAWTSHFPFPIGKWDLNVNSRGYSGACKIVML